MKRPDKYLLRIVLMAAAAAAAALPACAREQAPWVSRLHAQVQAIDSATPGALGVYVKRLGDDSDFDHHGQRRWYLASTIKVPVAIAVLQEVEAGRLRLDQPVTLREADFVDGAGDLIWQKPGAVFPLRTLIAKSIEDSDSTATDMLIRLIGEDALNRRVASWVDGFGPITTILQVRYDVYGELHPGVAALSNMDLVGLRKAPAGAARLRALLDVLDADADELRLPSIDAAFARYYAGERNSATLQAFAALLEKLVEGELLSAANTGLLLGHMRRITTGSQRIAAGLPRGMSFAQKTGTQIGRACNVGAIAPGDDAQRTVIVAACLEDFGDIAAAESALRKLGAAIAQSDVLR